MSDFSDLFSTNVRQMKRSAIRELLKLTQKPDIISFAGGLPSPDSFAVAELTEVIDEVMKNEASYVLQYGTTEGDPVLREMILEHYRDYGIDVDLDNILVTTASQQGLDLVSKVFIDRGDKVIVGLPSYLGGLGAMKSYGAELIGVELDDEGMKADELEKVVEELMAKGDKPKFIYIVPDFQNPAGITMSEARRMEILRIAKKHNLLIIEDSPYRELRFEGEHQKTMYQLDDDGRVILLGTFSKIFVPGFRIGWILANKEISDKLVISKQNTDLCTSPFTQRIAGRFIEKGYLSKSIKRIIGMYHKKRDIMLNAFEEYMPEGVTWTRPEGGLFLFLHLPEYIDTEELMKDAIDKKVAFVAGANFHCNGSGRNTARINFSFTSEEMIVEGVKRLAAVIKEAIKKHNMAEAKA